jgi:uncharacterized protein YodC (DUF2158 family)
MAVTKRTKKSHVAPMRAGDVVTLKSGGQRMTVERVGADAKVSCIWTYRGKSVREAFDANLLKLANEEMTPLTLEDIVRIAGGAPDADPEGPNK